MRHRKSGVKLNRTTSHRQAMFRNMVTSLFKYDRIKTTDTKAKELRRWADHIITLAKRGDLNARRQALAIVREKDVVHKLFDEAQKRFGKVNGGYTRIIKIGNRPGDAAPVSLIELVTVEAPAKKKKKKAAPKKQAAKPTAAKTAKDEPKADAVTEEAGAKAEAVEEADAKKTKKPAAKAKAPAKKADAEKAPEKKAPAKKAPAKKAAPKADAKEAKAAPKAKKAAEKKADEDKE